MEERLYDFYSMLPGIKYGPYLLGYTEALSRVEGVRVVPTYDFTSELPIQFRRFFDTVSYPCYYVPIKLGDRHFGFILKGEAKMTSRFSTYYPFFNLDALLDPRPYIFVVEGIKDAGIFLERGEPVMSMLTSGLSMEQAAIFRQFGKSPIVVHDNDAAGMHGLRELLKYQQQLKVRVYAVPVHGHKDMGNYYDSPQLRPYVEHTYMIAKAIAQSIPKDVQLFTRSA